MQALFAIAGFLLLGAVVTTATRPDLRHFKASEFGVWWPLMSTDLLVKLDAFREAWGDEVAISPATGALGRNIRDEEPKAASQHNVLRWGEVRAADIMPKDMLTSADRRRAVQVARQVGFTGIGVYPGWEPSPGLHLDVRRDRTAANPSTWSGIKVAGITGYFGIERGLV